jgi:hypothetical protein
LLLKSLHVAIASIAKSLADKCLELNNMTVNNVKKKGKEPPVVSQSKLHFIDLKKTPQEYQDYIFNGKNYMGSKYGVAGVLYLLIRASRVCESLRLDTDLQKAIKHSVKMLSVHLQLFQPDKTTENQVIDDDKIGTIPLFTLAAQTYP